MFYVLYVFVVSALFYVVLFSCYTHDCSYDVPILIICLRYSSLSLLPSLSLPLSHVSVAMTVVLLTGWYSNCYLLNVNEVLLLC